MLVTFISNKYSFFLNKSTPSICNKSCIKLKAVAIDMFISAFCDFYIPPLTFTFWCLKTSTLFKVETGHSNTEPTSFHVTLFYFSNKKRLMFIKM